MTDQRSSRAKPLLDRGQAGVKSLIRDPVKDAVREALAEERIRADDERERTPSTDEGRTEDGNRVLRPAVLLPVLGLVAVGAIVRRRRPATEAGGPNADDDGSASIPDTDTDSDECSPTE